MKSKGIRSLTILVEAAVRNLDFAGWGDTWFSEHGSVLNLTVWSKIANQEGPYCGVKVSGTVSLSDSEGMFKLKAPDVSKAYQFDSGYNDWNKEDLLEAVVCSVGVPKGLDVELEVKSPVVPKGSSVGSSAAVSVALVAVLEKIARWEVDSLWIARKTHEIETQIMGIQCGIQDMASIARAGGLTLVDIYQYPNFAVYPCKLDASTITEIENRLLTIVYGGEHSSSDVHHMVIKELKNEGRLSPKLESLRLLPAEARFCFLRGDLAGVGKVMRRNTQCQRELHKDLISSKCQELIDFCQKNGSLGEKVNGAGGKKGGSLSVFCGKEPKEVVAAKIAEKFPDVLVLEHQIADKGLKIALEY